MASKRKGKKFGKINPIKVGDIFTMRSGKTCEVTEYLSATKIKVSFADSYSVWVRYKAVREGSIQHPLDRKVRNVGFIGFGSYTPKTHKEAYSKWVGIIERVYDNNFHKKKNGGRYIGTLLHRDWNNFQNFAEWFYQQEYQNGWEIDKDLLCKDVSIYSSETCVLVPRNINMATIYNKGFTRLSGAGRTKKPFQVNLSEYNQKITVGYATDEESASIMYKAAKLSYIKKLIKGADMSATLKNKLTVAAEVKYVC